MNLVISKCVTAVILSDFSGHYLLNRSTLDIGVLGYIGIVQHKEHSPEVLFIPSGTPCIYMLQSVRGHSAVVLTVTINGMQQIRPVIYLLFKFSHNRFLCGIS